MRGSCEGEQTRCGRNHGENRVGGVQQAGTPFTEAQAESLDVSSGPA